MFRAFPSKIVLSILISVITGLGNAALIPLITKSVYNGRNLSELFIGLCLAVLLLRSISVYIMTKISSTTVLEMRKRFFLALNGASFVNIEKLGPARVSTAFHSDISDVSSGVTSMPGVVIGTITTVGLLAYVGYLNLMVLGLACGFLVVGATVYFLLVRKGNFFFRRSRLRLDLIHSGLEGILRGTKEIKINRELRSRNLNERLIVPAVSIRNDTVRALNLYQVGESWGELLAFMAIGLVLFSGLAQGQEQTNMEIVLALLYLTNPMVQVLSLLPNVVRAAVAYENLEKLYQKINDCEIESWDESGGFWDTIRLEKVTFDYDAVEGEHPFRVGPLNMHFRKGEVVFISGGNGSGKTTLLKLLTLLYKPSSGCIYFGTVAVDERNRDALRQNFSAVYSDHYLFGTLSKPDFDRRVAQAYLERFGLSQKTRITEDGSFSTQDLSAGQKRRLSLVNALLEDRDIIVFDEFAADQDVEYKKLFYETLLPELRDRGKLVIAITHDESYFHCCDRRIRLENGTELDSLRG